MVQAFNLHFLLMLLRRLFCLENRG
jgi:hypothetical protein